MIIAIIIIIIIIIIMIIAIIIIIGWNYGAMEQRCRTFLSQGPKHIIFNAP